MKMDQTIHRLLMTVGGITTGIGSLLAATDPALGVEQVVWSWIAFVGAVSILAANTIRTYYGTEPTSP